MRMARIVEAAELLGVSERHCRRLRDRYEEDGAEGIIDRRRGRGVCSEGAAGPDRLADRDLCDEVLRLHGEACSRGAIEARLRVRLRRQTDEVRVAVVDRHVGLAPVRGSRSSRRPKRAGGCDEGHHAATSAASSISSKVEGSGDASSKRYHPGSGRQHIGLSRVQAKRLPLRRTTVYDYVRLQEITDASRQPDGTDNGPCR
jgi:hypothetical protein